MSATDIRIEGRCIILSGIRGIRGIHDASATLRGIGSPLLFACYLIPEPWTIVLSSGTPFYRGEFGDE